LAIVGPAKVTDNAEIQNALLAIHSRLGAIEGKINLVARAERPQILSALEEIIKSDPLLGQIYLALNGQRTQQEVLEYLKASGIATSQPTVSRRMNDLVTEYGIAAQTDVGNGIALSKDNEVEQILNLSKRIKTWLTSAGETLPGEARPGNRTRRRGGIR
jgi:hypothetical protein